MRQGVRQIATTASTANGHRKQRTHGAVVCGAMRVIGASKSFHGSAVFLSLLGDFEMIKHIDSTTVIKEFDRSKLPDHWGQYFEYEKDNELHELTKRDLLRLIEDAKMKTQPYVDSKIIISRLLTDLGDRHTFHRQFNERHADIHKEQVLGMQLYRLIIEDTDEWFFLWTQHPGHVYENATYFQGTY
jgi:hypothetical protein